MTTITFAHLDAAMRIVREPARPAVVEAQEEAALEAKAAAARGDVETGTRPAAVLDRPRAQTR